MYTYAKIVQASSLINMDSKIASTTSLQSTVTGAKLFAYLTPAANIISTLKDATALHDGITTDNCVYFSSVAMRRINVPVPIGVCNMHQYLDYLNSNNWSKMGDIKDLTPGSICFTTNDSTGYPTHTFVFMGWVNAGDYTLAYVADNQGTAVHTRSMLQQLRQMLSLSVCGNNKYKV